VEGAKPEEEDVEELPEIVLEPEIDEFCNISARKQ